MMQRQGFPEPTGQAKITPAYNLPCRYILHTVGPIIQWKVTRTDRELLASCYRSCLELAAENSLESVAFCCISTGGFYPYDTLEEYWAFWSRYIWINRYAPAPKPVYDELLALVKEKDYFVLIAANP